MPRRLAITLLLGTSACAGIAPLDPGDDDSTSSAPTLPLPPDKAAVVLAHGFGGSADDWDPQIITAIEADGHAVLRAEVPSADGVKERATALGPQIDAFLAATGAAQVHIIAHSMGGLDARYLISSMGYAPKVASLTTISTPHAGSPLADVALGLQAGDQAAALQALAELTGLVDRAALDRALVDLSEANAATFAAANPDVAGVRYQSFAGFSTPGGIENPNAATACAGTSPDALRPLLFLPSGIVGGLALVPNDGIVSVASATHTGFQGCIAADHLDQPGVPGVLPSTFDAPAFYKGVVAKLVP